jgi:hypothetical protein
MNELIRAMSMAEMEINQLRQRNAVLQATADTVAIFGAALLGRPERSGMGEDAAWLLRNEIRRLEKQATNLPADGSGGETSS